MAGAGYDISLAASDSKALGQTTFGGTYIVFSGASLSGGNNDQTTKPTSDATATNRSPGTTNGMSTGGDNSLPKATTSNNGDVSLSREIEIVVALVVAIVLLFVKR